MALAACKSQGEAQRLALAILRRGDCALSTRITYSSHANVMLKIFDTLDISENAVPSSIDLQRTLAAYAADPKHGGSSIAPWMSGIKKHFLNSFEHELQTESLDFKRLKKALIRINTKGVGRRVATCMTRDRMDKLAAKMMPGWSGLRNLIMTEMMHNSLLRFRETNILTRLVLIFKSGYAWITIPHSKRDPRPVQMRLGRKSTSLLKVWLPLLPRGCALLFPSSYTVIDVPVSLKTFNKELRLWAKVAGFTKDEVARATSQGFRAGKATDLFDADFTPLYIQILGRWNSDSFLQYLRPKLKQRDILTNRRDVFKR